MPRFRIHTLLIATFLSAIAIVVGNAVYSSGKAKLVEFSAGDVDRLFPPAKIVEDNGRYRVTLRSRYRPVADVSHLLGLNQLVPGADSLDRHQVTFESYEREALEEVIALWPQGDVRAEGSDSYVLSGRVADQDNRALPEAIVTLHRDAVVVGKGATRRDGTFSIGYKFKASSTYRLLVEWADVAQNQSMSTRRFTIRKETPERLVHVRIRQ